MASNNVEFLTGALSTTHGFFTRNGGVTEGHLGGLNCGSSFDVVENIRENQKRAMEALGSSFGALTILKQIHSNIVHVVEDAVLPRSLEGDALVTKNPDMVIGVLTADCVPILFHDAQANIIGAAHAGWKGALYGVVENTIAAMEKLGANRKHIDTCIGACIRQASYEVGTEYVERFITEDASSKSFFMPTSKHTHFMFDLPGYVKTRLLKAGVGNIADIEIDTCSNPHQFFSCRRAFLQGETGFGNGLSAIRLARP
jgi:YfiH family protein